METNQYPPPPEGPTVKTVERTHTKRRGGLPVLLLMFAAVIGITLYSCAQPAKEAPPAPAVIESPSPSASPEPQFEPIPSEKVIQVWADRLLGVASTQPPDVFNLAFGEARQSFGRSGCIIASRMGEAQGTREFREQVAGAKDQLLVGIPEGFDQPRFAVARAPFQGHKGWFVLAVVCLEDRS